MRNRLFLKISIALCILLIGLGAGIAWITFSTANNYYLEAHQKLNADLAKYTTDHVNTFTADGEIDSNAIGQIMHSMMIINPSVEVYLIDDNGKILTHVAPYKEVVKTRVDLKPIKEFLASGGQDYVLGDDPRQTNGSKIFSAAPVLKDGKTIAYYYIILAGEEHVAALSSLKDNYSITLGGKLLMVSLLAAFIIGSALIWYQTRSLSTISTVMSKFKSGDYSARIPHTEKHDFQELSDTFNDMASQIERNIQKIESIDSFRRELIANISHDLKTPLSIIQGYLETLLLKEGSISPEEQKQHLETIMESSKKLSGVVNQLFELTKLESSQMKILKEPFPLDELVQDMLQRYQILAREKQIKLSFINVEKLPLAYADISLVERAMQNLMDNALKFTPMGGIVSVYLSADDNHLEFKITDSGPGIPENEQTIIFERYQKGGSSNGRNLGSGLGLSIAKRIIELHDSNIRVSSKINEGATFTFELPVYPD